MTDRAVAALLTLALSCAGAVPLAAAQSAAAPQMNTGHTANRSPKTSAVSPTADQIEASKVIGATVEEANGATVAKIADLIVDRRSGAATLAIVAPAGNQSFDHGQSAIAWSSLRFEPRPTPHFVTRLSGQTVAAGGALVEQGKNGKAYFDVKNDLLGKEVVGAHGASLGHVHDVVLTLGTGRLVALEVDIGGFISIGAKDHAVAWDAANPQVGTKGGPVHVALTEAQIAGAPVTATMAPAPIAPKPGNNQVQIRRDSTGNISGSWTPAPANNR
ncbi:MAG TPA: PRC-barrel domain-containing protein [Stellaceae bacterium]|jgi:sporulation protein YlmC with PRC-barrel domain